MLIVTKKKAQNITIKSEKPNSMSMSLMRNPTEDKIKTITLITVQTIANANNI
jgi:hypothetical protein